MNRQLLPCDEFLRTPPLADARRPVCDSATTAGRWAATLAMKTVRAGIGQRPFSTVKKLLMITSPTLPFAVAPKTLTECFSFDEGRSPRQFRPILRGFAGIGRFKAAQCCEDSKGKH